VRDRHTDAQTAVANIHFASAISHAKCNEDVTDVNIRTKTHKNPIVKTCSNCKLSVVALRRDSMPESSVQGNKLRCFPNDNDAFHYRPSGSVVGNKNSSVDEIANVNIFTTISYM